jgi:uncharacterized protein (DUF488 family)
MDTEAFAEAVAWLEGQARDSPTAFMCAESLWWRCHRRMIADVLTVRGWDVRHLMARGRAEPHRLHPAARPLGAAVRYDVAPPTQLRLAD